jgi:energy-coupling factor transporter ATP-binding protein EcfA2
MFELLKKLNDQGKTIIYVTHSRDLASKATRKIVLLDGQIVDSNGNGNGNGNNCSNGNNGDNGNGGNGKVVAICKRAGQNINT